jgi:hypothetical protein
MSSFLKQTLAPGIPGQENAISIYEKHLQSLEKQEDLDLMLKKLQYLGLHFDPFESNHSQECEAILKDLNLHEMMTNPFQATNILLQLLDKTEEKLLNLKQ